MPVMLLTGSTHHRRIHLALAAESMRLEGHTNRMKGAAFSADGRYIVSCGDQSDRTVRIWDAARRQQLLCSEEYPEGFLAVAVLPDGHHVVTTGKDGLGRLWRWKK
jgi:WD40 repeat protein